MNESKHEPSGYVKPCCCDPKAGVNLNWNTWILLLIVLSLCSGAIRSGINENHKRLREIDSKLESLEQKLESAFASHNAEVDENGN